MTNFENDIPLDLARRAHAGTSFVPEERGDQERRGYADQMQSDLDYLTGLCDGDAAKLAALDGAFPAYRERMRQLTTAHLFARSRCASTMITGGSNFPTRRNQKANRSSDKRLEELLEGRKRALAKVRALLCPEERAIMSGDSDAGERLQQRIAELEAQQERWRTINIAIHRNSKRGPEAQIAALGAVGLSEEAAADLLKPDFMGRVGIPNYQLTNNAANIRRLKARAVGVERAQATPASEAQGEHARFEDCPTDNRVRLFFAGKPPAETRATLKGCGFRWAPSLGAWQAYRNPRSLEVARRVAGIITA